jgi:hypothetical protein
MARRVVPKKRGRRVGHREIGEHGPICAVCSHPEVARIDYLCASGGQIKSIAEQFGLPAGSVYRHNRRHIGARFKKIVGASKLESFDMLVQKAAEGSGETLDILDLLIRGHSQMWSIALDSGSALLMAQHANKILAATELRSKITRELVPGPTLQVNNYLLHDALQIVNILRDHPEAAEKLVRWHERRTNTRVIEHAAAD